MRRRRRHHVRPSRVATLGAEHRGQVEDRGAAAARLVGGPSPVAARIAAALPGYLLAHDSGDVARQCQLLEPLPAPGEVRVVVTPGRARGAWHLDVATLDRPGLLAACTGVLAEESLDVAQAVVATWDDGGALEAFVVCSAVPPAAGVLQAAFEASLDRPLDAMPVVGAEVRFDADASPLYTRCDVEAPDRPGLLHAVASAIAAAGADVHAARVATVDGVARDRFDLSDRAGRKLDATVEAAVRTGLACGVTAPRSRARVRRRRGA